MLTHPVRFNETHKDGEEDRGRHCLGAFTKKCHRVFKRILERIRNVSTCIFVFHAVHLSKPTRRRRQDADHLGDARVLLQLVES